LISRPEIRGHKGDGLDAVLLDAAGTLIRPHAPVGETYAAVAGRYGAALDAGRLARAFGEVFGEMPALAFDWTSMAELQRLEREWWHTLVYRVIQRIGGRIGEFDAFFEALYEHYARGDAWECFPEVPRVLDGLRARGCKLAVVSNFDSRLPGILQALGVRKRLDAVVYSSEAGCAKPDPAIFKRALAAIGVAPERAIHVGDRVRSDVGGAVAAGLEGVLIRRGNPLAASSGQVLRSLDELLGVSASPLPRKR
jgi:putative hydrolase of the HAD superfamily